MTDEGGDKPHPYRMVRGAVPYPNAPTAIPPLEAD